ncbi:MAG TPA: hypothetical protein VLS49_03755 [Usitatibacter sp.]|nr:hypothetical protein [Usitatibacter sp.]
MSRRGAALACALATAALLAAACSRHEEPAADAAAEQKAAGERARQGPFGGDLKALDKAKGLAADLNKKAEDEQEQVDRAQK